MSRIEKQTRLVGLLAVAVTGDDGGEAGQAGQAGARRRQTPRRSRVAKRPSDGPSDCAARDLVKGRLVFTLRTR